jgi:hypothetical protein
LTGVELHRLFQALSDAGGPQGGIGYSAFTVPGSAGHMVALSAGGMPGLLIQTAAGGTKPPRIQLSGLNASFGVACTIAVDGTAPQERNISILECTAPEEARPIFAEFGCSFLRLLGERPTMAQTAVAVTRFAAIFASLTRPSRQSVTGLIGELMLLLLSSDVAAAINCWRTNQVDHFDFVAPDARVECKASSSGMRLHSLSWEQCNPPPGPALLASLFVDSAGGGTSVRELMARIEDRLVENPEAATRLRETVAATMGAALRPCLDVRFDEAVCEASLQWFDLRAVPAIRGELPTGVGGLRFISNLAMINSLGPSALVGTGLASLIPLQ